MMEKTLDERFRDVQALLRATPVLVVDDAARLAWYVGRLVHDFEHGEHSAQFRNLVRPLMNETVTAVKDAVAVADQAARDGHALGRRPAELPYDGAVRRHIRELQLRATGRYSEDEIAQAMAADAGRALPPSAAVTPAAVRAASRAAHTASVPARQRGRDRDRGMSL